MSENEAGWTRRHTALVLLLAVVVGYLIGRAMQRPVVVVNVVNAPPVAPALPRPRLLGRIVGWLAGTWLGRWL